MKRWIVLGMALFMTVLMLMTALPVSAASATVSVTASASTVKVGDTVTVTVKYSASGKIGFMDATISYDTNIVEYVSTGGSDIQANGNAGLIRFSFYTVNPGNDYSFTVSFKAKATGSCTFTLQTQEIGDWDTFDSFGTPSGSVTVSVQNPSLSNNANLSSLYISSGSLSPAFSPKVTSYQIVIPYSVATLTVSATTADKNAKLEVIGSRNMQVGKNTRVVKVTAPDGTVKSYTLNITRQENTGTPTGPSNPAQTEDAARVTVNGETKYIAKKLDQVTLPAGYGQVPLTINDTEFPSVQNSTHAIVLLYLTDENGKNGNFYIYNTVDMTFSDFQFTTVAAGVYAFLTPETSMDIPENMSQTFIEIGGQMVTAWAFPGDALQDYYLIYALSPSGNVGLYRYDRVEGTFQRYTAEVAVDEPSTELVDPPEEEKPVGFFGKIKSTVSGWADRLGRLRLIVIAVGAVLLLAAVIVMIILLVKRPRRYKH